MKEWARRILGAVGTGLFWAAIWAAVGALMRTVPSWSLDELWLGPPIGVLPGFVAGVVFYAVPAVAASGRRLDELSLSKVVAFGGMAGLLVGVLPFVINEPTNEAALWLVGVVVIGSMTLLGAASAAGSLALARTMRAGKA